MVSALDCYVGGLPFKLSIPPLLKHACGKQQLITMLAIKRSAGVTPEVNLRECSLYTPLPSANKVAHSGFEIRRRHYQKSRTGISVTP